MCKLTVFQINVYQKINIVSSVHSTYVHTNIHTYTQTFKWWPAHCSWALKPSSWKFWLPTKKRKIACSYYLENLGNTGRTFSQLPCHKPASQIIFSHLLWKPFLFALFWLGLVRYSRNLRHSGYRCNFLHSSHWRVLFDLSLWSSLATKSMATCLGCCGFYRQICNEKLTISTPEHASLPCFAGDHNLLMPTAHAPGFLDSVSHKFQNGVEG